MTIYCKSLVSAFYCVVYIFLPIFLRHLYPKNLWNDNPYIAWVCKVLCVLLQAVSCYIRMLVTESAQYCSYFLNKVFKLDIIIPTTILFVGVVQVNLTYIHQQKLPVPFWFKYCLCLIWYCQALSLLIIGDNAFLSHAIYLGIYCRWRSLVMQPLIGSALYYVRGMTLSVDFRDYVTHSGWRGFSLGESQLYCLHIGWYWHWRGLRMGMIRSGYAHVPVLEWRQLPSKKY